MRRLVAREQYFVVHAPRQTGKTTALGLSEGWMPVFNPDKGKTWDEKLYNHDIDFGGKTLHIVGL